jgi:transmembrane sensor
MHIGMVRRDTSAEIDAAAADWAARANNSPLSPDEQAELDLWLEGDTRRLGAYARARALFSHARRIKALGATFDAESFQADLQAEKLRHDPEPVTADEQDEPDVAAPPELQPADNDDDAIRVRTSRRRFLVASGGAVAATIIGVAGFSWQAAAQTYSTKRGEIRLIPLEDGSSMTLNTASTAKVRFTDQERQIELVQGEALFDVIKNAKRPFVVAAGDTEVRAIGTSFSVTRLLDAPVEVVVKQGEVEVTRGTLPMVAPQRIGANTRTIVPAAAPMKTAAVAPEELGRALAWREGMLSFEDMPLRDAVTEFARYSDTRITLADPSMGDEPVTGLFAANDPSGFAHAVAASLGARAQPAPDGVTLRR